MVVTSRGTQDELPFSNWCSPPYLYSILRGRDPLLVLRILLACNSAVECPAVNRVVEGSNPSMPVFILRPWPNWFKAPTFRVGDCGFESHWTYCHQCVGIEGYEDNLLSSSGRLGSESPKGNRSDTVIGMYSWKTFPWVLFVLGQMKPTLSKQWFELHLGIGVLKRTSLRCNTAYQWVNT